MPTIAQIAAAEADEAEREQDADVEPDETPGLEPDEYEADTPEGSDTPA